MKKEKDFDCIKLKEEIQTSYLIEYSLLSDNERNNQMLMQLSIDPIFSKYVTKFNVKENTIKSI